MRKDVWRLRGLISSLRFAVAGGLLGELLIFGILFALVIMTLTSHANAQAVPESGQILRDLEMPPDYGTGLEGPKSVLPKRPEEAPTAEKAGTKVKVRSYRFVGNTVFTSKELAKLLKADTGETSLVELKKAARVVTAYYRSHGFVLARAYVPEQEIKNGLVTITILEGRLGALKVTNNSRVSTKRIERTIRQPICGAGRDCTGALVESKSLERALLLAATLPGARLSSELRPGSAVGMTDLYIDVAAAPLFSGDVGINNYGNLYTGRDRITASAQINNPTGRGDRLVLQAVGALKMIYGGVQYYSPIGYRGLQLGLQATSMDYSLGDRFASLHAHGVAYTGGTSLTYPFVRSTTENVFASLSYSYNILKDVIDSQSQSNRRVLNQVSVGITTNKVDELFGRRALTTMSLTATGGDLRFSDPTNSALDAATAKTAGGFEKVQAEFSRLQGLSKHFSLYGKIEGQWAFKNLDSFEKMSLGGPSGVRAYPVGEASGDRAALATAELHFDPGKVFGGDLELKGFFDYGVAKINADPWVSGSNERTLHGGGLGLSWVSPVGVTLQATAAMHTSGRFRSEPDSSYRIWFSAGYRF